MLNQGWVMYESHQDFSLVWRAYVHWQGRARQLGFNPDQVLGIGCISCLQRLGVLVRLDLSEADLNDMLSLSFTGIHGGME